MLAEIGGQVALARVLGRAAGIPGVDEVALAIPRDPADDVLEELGTREGVTVVRGSNEDVLDRYVDAAHATGATAVVRITADCPLLDPAVAGAVLARFLDEGVDYASNVHPPTFPDGYDTEVMSGAASTRPGAKPSIRSSASTSRRSSGGARIASASPTSRLTSIDQPGD